MQATHDSDKPPIILSFRVGEARRRKLWRFLRAWALFFGAGKPSDRAIAIVEIARGRN